MSILSFQDVAIYAPGTQVDPGALQGAILKAEMLAESPQGACRSLAKQEYVETPHVGDNGIARLEQWPIDPAADFKVETRYYGGTGIQHSLYHSWLELDPDEYELDPDLCEISIHRMIGRSVNSFSLLSGRSSVGYPYRHSSGRTRTSVATRMARRPQIRVTYTAGFDFHEDPLSRAAQQIKTAVGCILGLQNSCLSQGVSKKTYNGFYTTEIKADVAQLSVSSQGSTLMGDALQVLHQFRPKEFAT